MPELDAHLLALREKAGRARRLDKLISSTEWQDALAILRELIVDRCKRQSAKGASQEDVQRCAGGIEALQEFIQTITNSKIEGELALEEYARSETAIPEG